MDFSPVKAIVAAVVAVLAYQLYRAALPKPIPTIPYDASEARHLLGSLPAITSHVRQHGLFMPWLLGLNARHGDAPLVQFFSLPFTRPTLVLCDFQESQDLLVRRGKDFDRSQLTADGFAGTIPDHHASMRTHDSRFRGNKELVRDLMSPSFLQDVSSPQIYEKSLALVELWTVKAKLAKGRPFEALGDIYDAALDAINAAAFGAGDDLSIVKRNIALLSGQTAADVTRSATAEEPVTFPRSDVPPEITTIRRCSAFLASQVVSPAPTLTTRWRMLTDSRLRRDMRDKDELVKAQFRASLAKLEAGDETQRSAADFMIQREYSVSRKEGRAPNFYSGRACDELFGYIIAGHETTSSALCWTLKLLADHQHVQLKLRQALRSSHPAAAAASRLPTALEITKTSIPYLDAVMEESLRVGAPTPLIAREAMRDTTLLGHQIPKGAALIISNAGPSYRRPSMAVPDSVRSETSVTKFTGGAWDPKTMNDFIPERWLKRAEKSGDSDDDEDLVYDANAGPFLTFGLGPRGCFGRKLAYLEMKQILTLLLWSFHLRKLEGEIADYQTEEGVTVSPKNCYVGIDLL